MGRNGRMGRRMAMRATGGPQMARGARKAGLLGPRARQRLADARKMMKAEDFAGAAAEFASLANGASTKGLHVMAIKMKLAAARAQHRAGDTAAAVESAKEAIAFGEGVQDKKRAARKLTKFLGRLSDAGHTDEAAELRAFAKERYGLKKLPEAQEGTINRNQRRNLPKKCSACGAPVNGDKVEWNDDATADCPHCGNTL